MVLHLEWVSQDQTMLSHINYLTQVQELVEVVLYSLFTPQLNLLQIEEKEESEDTFQRNVRVISLHDIMFVLENNYNNKSMQVAL